MPSSITAIVDGRVVTEAGSVDPGCVVFEGEKITDVGWMDEVEVPGEAERISAKDCFVLPGFIEIHVHGGDGHWPLRGEVEDYVGLSEHLARRGVTAFLATLGPASEKEYRRAIEAALEAEEKAPGARLLGLHMEGPYLSPEMADGGRHEHIRPPSMEEAEGLISAADGLIKMMTLAPELKRGQELIRCLVSHDVKPALGHSAATYEQAEEAFELGATHVTHIFNATPKLHHRDPGLDGAALVDDRVTVEFVADGHHLHRGTVALIVRAKQIGHCVAVTNALPVTGLGEGEHQLEGETIRISGGAARLRDGELEARPTREKRGGKSEARPTREDGDGELAGSILTMDRALENIMEFADVTLEDASLMCSLNPARVIDMGRETGQLAPGKLADIAILDERLSVIRTVVAGETVYEG